MHGQYFTHHIRSIWISPTTRHTAKIEVNRLAIILYDGSVPPSTWHIVILRIHESYVYARPKNSPTITQTIHVVGGPQSNFPALRTFQMDVAALKNVGIATALIATAKINMMVTTGGLTSEQVSPTQPE